MKMEKLIFGVMLMLSFSFKVNGQSNSSEQFKGLWQLDKYEAFDSITGKWHDAPKRIGYFGYILYDGAGHVAVQLFPPGFKKINSSAGIDSLDIDELRQMANIQSKCFIYFADYTILAEQNVIEHHIRSSNHPDEIGTTVKRNFEFKDNTLILTANELIGGSKTRLRWTKIPDSK